MTFDDSQANRACSWPATMARRIRDWGWSSLLVVILAGVAQAQNPPLPIPQPPLPGGIPKPQPKPQPQPQPKPGAKPPTTPPKTGSSTPPTTRRPPAKSEPKEDPPPPPESMFLDTKDGWRIHCTFYAAKDSDKDGKQVVPLLLIHGWEGQGGEYSRLATFLQTLGYSSIAVDLRGHGRSTRRVGESGDTTFDKLKTTDIQAMLYDVEVAKSFLLTKHNEGQLNIELLGVVGAELGAIIAMNWAAMDWNWAQPTGYKQGQDVKALVLLSPQQTFKGLSASDAMTNYRVGGQAVRTYVSVLIAVGANERDAYSDAKRVEAQFKRYRPKQPESMRDRDLIFVEPTLQTVLQGTKLLTPQLPFVDPWLLGFLKYRLAERSDEFPWKERKSPLGG